MDKEDSKKISPNEIGLEIGLVLSRFFLNTEHLHFGFWPDDLSVDLENLKKAQDCHSDQILNSIPDGVKTVLDVGSGSGGLAEKLVNNGYNVDCVSPSDYLSDAIEGKLKNSVSVYRSTFENLELNKKYDIVIFSESFQYVNIKKSLKKIPDLINQIINEVADPVRNLSAKYLDSHYPKEMKLLRWYFDKKIKRINRIYFSGNMTGDMFNNLKTYRVLLYRI